MIDEKNDHSDVIISSRIRLARNIADFPFINTCSERQRQEIEATVRAGLEQVQPLKPLSLVESSELEALERQFLTDLQLTQTPLGSASDCASITINEEDHVRITVTRNDFDLRAAWEQIDQLDDLCEQYLNFAFSPQWGYLTACPANVGTGMRVSVLLHLPGLVKTGQIEKAFRSLQRMNVVARGVFGDSAIGDFFRVSNQATLGREESELVSQVAEIVPTLVKLERQAREFLLTENREGLCREVAEALERLYRCDLDDDSERGKEEVLGLLSQVRMGAGMGLVDPADATRVQGMFELVQLRHQLLEAIAREDYGHATRLRDGIEKLEAGQPLGGNSE